MSSLAEISFDFGDEASNNRILSAKLLSSYGR